MTSSVISFLIEESAPIDFIIIAIQGLSLSKVDCICSLYAS